MICKTCLQDISGDCILTGRPDVAGVCVFCHYDTDTWDSNGQLVTKDQATRFKGWWTKTDLNLYDDVAETISKFYPYSSSDVYKILKKSRSIDFCIKVLEYSMSYNVSIEQSLKELEKLKCLNCNKIVRMAIHSETGEEYYYDCQNTLEANFNKHLWELEENCLKIEFYYYYFLARIRGLYQNHIKRHDYNLLPKFCVDGVSCGITNFSEIKIMYFKHRWIPYCITQNGSSYICERVDLADYEAPGKSCGEILNDILGD